MMGLILGSGMMLVTLLTFLGTKEKKYRKEDLPTEGFFTTYKVVFRNKPYVLLLLSYALHMTGISFLTAILAYYTENVLHRSDITTFVLILLLVTAMIFIPVSVLTSKKIGKGRTYQICFAIISSACALIYFLGHRMPVEFFFAVIVYAGIGVGFSYVAPFAMVPDAIEFEAAKTGRRNEGAYYGMWTFISKLGTALALFVSGQILALGGYVSQTGEGMAVQPPEVFNAIRLIIGPLPMVIFIAAIAVLRLYPLDRKEYREKMPSGESGNRF
jgi:GPH family glycoside/pentoside/hexuronide:cation symporter